MARGGPVRAPQLHHHPCHDEHLLRHDGLPHAGRNRFAALPPVFADFGRLKLIGWVSPLLLVAPAVGLLLILLYRFTALGREMLALAPGRRPPSSPASGSAASSSSATCSPARLRRYRLAGRGAHRRGNPLDGRATRPGLAAACFSWPRARRHPVERRPGLGFGTFLGSVLVTMLTNGLLLLKDRRVLGPGLPRSSASARGADGQGAAGRYLAQPEVVAMSVSPARSGATGSVRLSSPAGDRGGRCVQPVVPSPFNIQVLLLAVAVNTLIALLQMSSSRSAR